MQRCRIEWKKFIFLIYYGSAEKQKLQLIKS